MAHNEGRLRGKVDKLQLNTWKSITLLDRSARSNDYFNVVEIPNRLTGGKNVIKFNAAGAKLADKSRVYFEILDWNGDPIYWEPLNYTEQDGTRVIAVYIYPETAPGTCTMYFAGRAKIHPSTGAGIKYSTSPNRSDFRDRPNILWEHKINVAPKKANSSEIIYIGKGPRMTLRENIVHYMTPINLPDVGLMKSASMYPNSALAIEGIPLTTNNNVNLFASNTHEGEGETPGNEGEGEPGTPEANLGSVPAGLSILSPPILISGTGPGASEEQMDEGETNYVNPANAGTNEGPIEISSPGYQIIQGYSRLRTTNFPLSQSMENGYISIPNPKVEVQIGTHLGTDGKVFGQLGPDAGKTVDTLAEPTVAQTLTGSNWQFRILQVINSTTAYVSQVQGQQQIQGAEGAFSYVATRDLGTNLPSGWGTEGYIIRDITASADFTSSHIEPFITVDSLQSQSFAEVILSNIEPATGDVYKVKTLFKPSGQYGDFVDAGDTELERVELLEDTGSYENVQSIGMIRNRLGFFTSLADYNEYWENTNGYQDAENTLTPTFDSNDLINGIKLTPAAAFDASNNRYGYIHLKSAHEKKVFADTRYNVRFDAHVQKGLSGAAYASTDPNVPKARIDVYVSGSKGTIDYLAIPELDYRDQFRTSTNNINTTLQQGNGNNYPNDYLTDDKGFGVRVGTIELGDDVPLRDQINVPFFSDDPQNIDLYFVVRRGLWTIANVSVMCSNETKFTPNYTRMNIRIPSEYIKVPMTFKFQYFDYLGNKAAVESTLFPVMFHGDNTIITGNQNVFSGSIYIGNSEGSGIELAGIDSAYIRSIGYEGFTSASAGSGSSGFMFYSGSVLPNSGDAYTGVGLELVQDSSSYFRYRTNPAELTIRTDSFFLGGDNAFISGANGNIEITSSNFHLTNEGDVTMQGTITATAGGTIGGASIGSASLSYSPYWTISASNDTSDPASFISSSTFKVSAGGQATASNLLITGDSTFGGTMSNPPYWKIDNKTDTTLPGGFISSSNFKVSADGRITASSGQIAGATIGVSSLSYDPYWKISTSTSTTDPGSFISSSAFKVRADGVVTASAILLSGGTLDNPPYWKVDNRTDTTLPGGFISSSNFKVSAGGNVTGSQVLFTGGKIAGWTIDDSKLSNTGIHVSASYGIRAFDPNNDTANYVVLKYTAADNFGITGASGSKKIFELGSTNQIASWSFDDTKIISNLGVNSQTSPGIVIKAAGTIETDPFISGLTANATGWQIRSDGRAELKMQ